MLFVRLWFHDDITTFYSQQTPSETLHLLNVGAGRVDDGTVPCNTGQARKPPCIKERKTLGTKDLRTVTSLNLSVKAVKAKVLVAPSVRTSREKFAAQLGLYSHWNIDDQTWFSVRTNAHHQRKTHTSLRVGSLLSTFDFPLNGISQNIR